MLCTFGEQIIKQVSKTKTADRANKLYRRFLFLLRYVRLPNLIRVISFIYIPLHYGGFCVPSFSTAIPICFNGILYFLIVYSVVIVAIRQSLFVLARTIDIPAKSATILAQEIQADVREYQSLIPCIRQKLCRGVRNGRQLSVKIHSIPKTVTAQKPKLFFNR